MTTVAHCGYVGISSGSIVEVSREYMDGCEHQVWRFRTLIGPSGRQLIPKLRLDEYLTEERRGRRYKWSIRPDRPRFFLGTSVDPGIKSCRLREIKVPPEVVDCAVQTFRANLKVEIVLEDVPR